MICEKEKAGDVKVFVFDEISKLKMAKRKK